MVTMGRFLRSINTAVRLKCPRCTTGALFRGMFEMYPRCSHCRLDFEREHVFYVGAMYLNYGVIVAIALPGYLVLDYFTGLILDHQLVLWISFATLFPLFFFRISKSLWLVLNYLCNPEE